MLEQSIQFYSINNSRNKFGSIQNLSVFFLLTESGYVSYFIFYLQFLILLLYYRTHKKKTIVAGESNCYLKLILLSECSFAFIT